MHSGEEEEDIDGGVGNGQGSGGDSEGDGVPILTPLQFKRRYVHRNLPCVVLGLDESHFGGANRLWTRRVEEVENCECQGGLGGGEPRRVVNESWFRHHVENETPVPVRVTPSRNGELDDDGRAVECDTAEMSLSSWIRQLRGRHPDPNMYLKDWHLVKSLESKARRDKSDPAACKAKANGVDSEDKFDPGSSTIYSVPPIFEPDLLNSFLLRFTEEDYRFMYWGPERSCTGLHSDVMNSFSWSHNVCGKKEWTFYPPPPPSTQQSPSAPSSSSPSPTMQSFVLTQSAGETVFVPSTWRHEVVNVFSSSSAAHVSPTAISAAVADTRGGNGETLSINHNWFTSSNVDLVLDCLLSEAEAVEAELDGWGIDRDDFAARESMLRGCAGMDLTSFFLAVMVGLAELLRERTEDVDDGDGDDDKDADEKYGGGGNDEDELWERAFGIVRLADLLRKRLLPPPIREEKEDGDGVDDGEEDGPSGQRGLLNLERRLEATLVSRDLARRAVEVAEKLCSAADV